MGLGMTSHLRGMGLGQRQTVRAEVQLHRDPRPTRHHEASCVICHTPIMTSAHPEVKDKVDE